MHQCITAKACRSMREKIIKLSASQNILTSSCRGAHLLHSHVQSMGYAWKQGRIVRPIWDVCQEDGHHVCDHRNQEAVCLYNLVPKRQRCRSQLFASSNSDVLSLMDVGHVIYAKGGEHTAGIH